VSTGVGVDVTKFFRAGVLKRGAGVESESEKCDSAHLYCLSSVENHLVSGSRSNRILQFRTGLDWISKKLNRIRYGYPNRIDHCSLMLNQSSFKDINRIGSKIRTGFPD